MFPETHVLAENMYDVVLSSICLTIAGYCIDDRSTKQYNYHLVSTESLCDLTLAWPELVRTGLAWRSFGSIQIAEAELT